MSDEAKNLLPWHAQGNTLRDADGRGFGYFDHPSGAEEAARYGNACARMGYENITPEGYHRLALALREARADLLALVDFVGQCAMEGEAVTPRMMRDRAEDMVAKLDREHDVATGRAAEFHPPTAFGGIGGA